MIMAMATWIPIIIMVMIVIMNMIMAMPTWIPIMIVIVIMIVTVIMIMIMTMPTWIPMHKSTIVGSRDKLQRIGAEQLQ